MKVKYIYLKKGWKLIAVLSKRLKIQRLCHKTKLILIEFVNQIILFRIILRKTDFTVGKYCGSYGLTAETGDCDPGYYCPEGQTVATPANYSCPLGYFCVGGKELPEPCASGTYQVCIYLKKVNIL